MGIGGYFKAKKPDAPSSSPAPVEMEKSSISPVGSDNMELQPPHSRFGSSRNSISARSTQSSQFMDDIKHEVMVNYLYQQQCSRLWVSDGSGEAEGVLLRKARNQYMACPPQLGSTALAAACAAMNVQVSSPWTLFHPSIPRRRKLTLIAPSAP
jgi:hypothetical protein